MSDREMESRPAQLSGYQQEVNPNSTISISTPSAERLAQQVDGALVVVVATPGDRYRRRVFLTIAAAQNHAERARARGHFARVFLAQLEPVSEVRA